MARVEHAANLAFLDAQGRREGGVGQPLFAQGLVERCLGGQDRAGDGRRPAPGRAWRWNVLTPCDAAGERFLQAVCGFCDRFGERVAVRERLVEVGKCDRKAPVALLVEVDGVAVPDGHDRNSLEVAWVDAELLAHAEKCAGLEGFPAVLHHGVAVAVVEGAVAPLAPRAVESDGNPVPARQLSCPRYELAPVHGRSIAQKCTNGQGPSRAVLCDLVKAGGPASGRAVRRDRAAVCGNVVAMRGSARTAAAMNAPLYQPRSRIRRNAGFPPSASASAGEEHDPWMVCWCSTTCWRSPSPESVDRPADAALQPRGRGEAAARS